MLGVRDWGTGTDAHPVQLAKKLTGAGVREGLQWLVEQARPGLRLSTTLLDGVGPLPHGFIGVRFLGIKSSNA